MWAMSHNEETARMKFSTEYKLTLAMFYVGTALFFLGFMLSLARSPYYLWFGLPGSLMILVACVSIFTITNKVFVQADDIRNRRRSKKIDEEE